MKGAIKPFLIPLLLGLFLNGSCDSGNEDQEEFNRIWNLGMLYSMRCGQYQETSDPVVTVSDQKNGTIRISSTITYYYTDSNCEAFNGSFTSTDHYYVKKCAQGQVYRNVENDCQGKGSETDWWGAEKFDDCYEDEYSCYSIDPDTVGASTSCREDNFNDKKWQVMNPPNYLPDVIVTELLELLSDVPRGIENPYWSLFSSYYIPEDNSGFVYPGDKTGTDLQYVICESET